jgi:hypothetical protein
MAPGTTQANKWRNSVNTLQASPRQPTSFTAAVRDFFGFLPGQTIGEFAAELKKLTADDRTEITIGLKAVGYNVADHQPEPELGPSPVPVAQ